MVARYLPQDITRETSAEYKKGVRETSAEYKKGVRETAAEYKKGVKELAGTGSKLMLDHGPSF